MQTIDPAAEEPKGKAHRLRRIAWTIGGAIVCIAISLIIVSLLFSEPERATGVASHSEDQAVAGSKAESEALPPAREHLAPESVAPPVAAVPVQPRAPEQGPEPAPQSSGQVGLLPPTPPAAVTNRPAEPKRVESRPAEPKRVEPRPAEPKRAEPRPAEPKPAASTRRPAQAPAASGHVAQIVLSSEAARFGQGDPISSPIVLAGGQEKRLVLYTELRGLAGHTVSHQWRHEGRTVAVIPFKVGGDRWRAHSNKRVTSDMKGEWQAVVVDSDGTVLASRSFVVR